MRRLPLQATSEEVKSDYGSADLAFQEGYTYDNDIIMCILLHLVYCNARPFGDQILKPSGLRKSEWRHIEAFARAFLFFEVGT